MSIYYTLHYNENGTTELVENTDNSTRAITNRDFQIGTYQGTTTTPETNLPDSDGDDFLDQITDGPMGGNDMTSYERFIDRSGLQSYMEGPQQKEDSVFKKLIDAALLAGIGIDAKGLEKIANMLKGVLPGDSPEIKAIREFYADRDNLKYFDPKSDFYIPGMENYNIIYGGLPGISEPGTGLEAAFKGRMDTIANTLGSASYMAKYWDKSLGPVRGLTAEEIQSIIDGTYKGPETPLTKRYKNLADVSSAEIGAMQEFKDKDIKGTDTPIDFKNIDMGDEFLKDHSPLPQNIPADKGFDPSGHPGKQEPTYDRSFDYGKDKPGATKQQKREKIERRSQDLGFSDIRLKENIELIGKSPSNINIYKFNYKDNLTTYQGVIANEVPWAAIEHDNGYIMVDYNKVDVEFKKWQ